MSSQIVAQKTELLAIEDLEVLKLPVKKNPLLKSHFRVYYHSTRVLRPYPNGDYEEYFRQFYETKHRLSELESTKDLMISSAIAVNFLDTAPSVERSDDRLSATTGTGSDFQN